MARNYQSILIIMLTWVEISKSALINNLKEFKKIVGPKIKLMAVVKSNAYGHGLVGVAKIIKEYIDYFGVAYLDEALILRKISIKKPILVLTYWDLKDIKSQIQALRQEIEFAVYTYPQAKILSKLSQKIGKEAKIHIKIDTGTSRIGVLPKDSLNFVLKCLKLPGLTFKGIFTHFANAEAYNQKYTLLQTERLKRVVEEINKKIGLDSFFDLIHAGCTASTIGNPATYFNLVRIGIGLYGLWPSAETRKLASDLFGWKGALTSKGLEKKQGIRLKLKPALSWKTKVIQVKELSAGTPIGYGCTYRCRRKTKIAVLPVGYWDGYDRKLSNKGQVLIRGRRAQIRGRVCMNLIMVEVTKIPNVKIGDEVVLIGKQGNEEITAEELAEKIGTINYEIVTRINPLLPRIYK